MRQVLAIAALIATGLLPGQEAVQARAADGASNQYQSVVAAMPDRNDVAIALRAAIRDGFPTPDVRIRVARIDIEPAGVAQRELHARGRILLDSAGDWIDFNTVALYDMETGEATTTAFEMETPRETARPVDGVLAAELKAEATRRLRAEFASQPASIEIAQVHSRPAGDLLALIADGSAHFGSEGSAHATVRALYDPRSGQWLQLDYELGSSGPGSSG